MKTQQAKVGQVLPGTRRAGWEVEELGIIFLFNLISYLVGLIVVSFYVQSIFDNHSDFEKRSA